MKEDTIYKRSPEAKSVRNAINHREIRLRFKNKIVSFTDAIRIGRALDNDYVINDPLISRYHCIIENQNGITFYIKDLDSTNATYLNNNPIGKGSRARLKQGDCIRIGNTEFYFQV